MHAFDQDTALTRTGDATFRGRIHRTWWILLGPNGGLPAALFARAATEVVGDDERAVRSLTVHYLSPPAEGDVDVEADVLRSGRAVTSLSLRMLQEGKVVAAALAAVARPRPAPTASFADPTMPSGIPAPDAVPVLRFDPERMPPITSRYDVRPVLGAEPYTGAPEAVTGGWLAFADHRPIDPIGLCAMSDAWLPAAFTRFSGPGLVALPTVDLTVHVRSIPEPGTEWAFVRFTTRTSRDGFLEEDGELWAPDGTLLAQSRQLAVVLEQPPA